MPEEIRLWHVQDGTRLEEYKRSGLDLESRLEDWLAVDISVLAPNLLVIGRQVETAFGGVIDLLCINDLGDLELIELKRRRTPREVTAQALDYGSWISDLSSDRIISIANDYLKARGPLEVAFKQKFGQALPDSLNGSHNMIIVAAEIDPSSERIVKYLSDSYGVGINAASFQYFQSSDGNEFLARTFLIEPSRVEYQTRTRSTSKRLPNLTYEELENIAEANGVQDLYDDLVTQMTPLFQRHTTRSSIGFTSSIDDSRKTVFSLIPQESDGKHGLRFQLYLERLATVLGMSGTAVEDLLPPAREEWKYYEAAGADYSGYAGYFKTADEVGRFVEGVKTQLRQSG